MPCCITLTPTEEEWTSPAHTHNPKYNSYYILNKKLNHEKIFKKATCSHNRKGSTVGMVGSWFIANRPIKRNDAQMHPLALEVITALLVGDWAEKLKGRQLSQSTLLLCQSCGFCCGTLLTWGSRWGCTDQRHDTWEPFKLSYTASSHLIQFSQLNFLASG